MNKKSFNRSNDCFEKYLLFKKDDCGLVYSTKLLLGLIMLVVIIGVVIGLSEDLNEKILSEEELSNLEKRSIEASEALLNSPGVPEDWEDRIDSNHGIGRNMLPGLALKDKNVRNGQFKDESSSSEKVMSNIISYHKLMILSANYDDLVGRNLFNDSLDSSIAIYPINCQIDEITMGDDLRNSDKDVIVINRTVKCDFLSKYVIYNFNDFELEGEDYVKTESCIHDNVNGLNAHNGDRNNFWLCRSFRIYRNSLEDYSFYLISPDNIGNLNVYYTIENLNETSDNMYRLNEEVIDLNPYFEDDLEGIYENIYTIHFKVPKNGVNSFKSILVAIPKNMTNDLKSRNHLRYDYFRVQDVSFVMKTSYD